MQTSLAEFLATKFCHDLAGPLGAISNGVEFLKEAGEGMADQATDLIEQSADEAISRLLFFRQAYGSPNAQTDVELDHVMDVSAKFFKQKKIELEWDLDESLVMLKGETRHRLIKLVLNVMMAVAGLLPRGGMIAIRYGVSKKGNAITIEVKDEQMKNDPVVEAVLCNLNPKPPLDSRNVQLFFTRRVIEQMRAEIEMQTKAKEVVITIRQP